MSMLALAEGSWELVAWLLTYAVHSTLLVGAAELLARRLGGDQAWSERLWRAALLGGLVTASVAVAVGGGWTIRPGVAPSSAHREDTREEAAGSAATVAPTAGAPSGGEGDPAAARASSLSGSASWRREPGQPWAMAVAAAWAAVALAGLGVLLHRRIRLRRTLAGRTRVEDADLAGFLRDLARRAGYRHELRLSTSSACPVPIVLGRREIVVPGRFLDELEPDQQRAGLAHEVAHIVRGDPAWLLLALAVERLFFFQPLNQLARVRLQAAGEHRCDEWALAQTGSPLALARCLAAVASWLRPAEEPLLLMASAMARPRSPLVRRVERVLAGPAAPAPRLARAGVALLPLAVLLAAPSVSSKPAVEALEPPAVEETGGGSHGKASSVIAEPGRADGPILRAPEGDPLDARWRWAFDEAARRRLRGFWVVYVFHTPLHPGDVMITDSESGSIVLSRAEVRPVRLSLSSLFDGKTLTRPNGDVAVLAHYGSAQPADVSRVGYRSTILGFDFGSTPIFWLGHAEEAQSLGRLRELFETLPADRLRVTLVEAASLHPTSDLVIPFLQHGLERSMSVAVRKEAAEGFDHHHDPRSVRILLEVARQDEDSHVRGEAAETIGEVRRPEALPALLELVSGSPDGFVRGEAVEALGEIEDERAVRALVGIAWEHPDPDTQREAVETLGERPEKAARRELERIRKSHPDEQVRDEAKETLEDR
jgi:beta-lactamase regulating signal transducer with metallopeptidase domain